MTVFWVLAYINVAAFMYWISERRYPAEAKWWWPVVAGLLWPVVLTYAIVINMRALRHRR